MASLCFTCVSEGTSLEEQVRRIKDIEAIESDSFVPQAFKSSRDDIKVRSVSLSVPAPHSKLFSLCFLLNFALCVAPRRLSRDGPDQIKHSHSLPFVPNREDFVKKKKKSTVPVPHTKAAAVLRLYLHAHPSPSQKQIKWWGHYLNVFALWKTCN